MLSTPLVPNYFEAEGERQSKDQIGLKVIMQIPNVSAAAGGINCREQKGRRAEQTQDHERRRASVTSPQCVQADQANEAREWKLVHAQRNAPTQPLEQSGWMYEGIEHAFQKTEDRHAGRRSRALVKNDKQVWSEAQEKAEKRQKESHNFLK